MLLLNSHTPNDLPLKLHLIKISVPVVGGGGLNYFSGLLLVLATTSIILISLYCHVTSMISIRIAVSFTYITHGLHASVFLQKPQNKHKLTLFSSHWIQRNGGLELRKFKCLAQNLTSTIWMKEFQAQKLLLDLKCLLSLGKPAFPILFQILLTHTHVCVSKIPVYANSWFLFFFKFSVFYVFYFCKKLYLSLTFESSDVGQSTQI